MTRIDPTHEHCVYITRHPHGYIYAGKGKTQNVSRGTYKGSGIRLTQMFLKEGFEFDTWRTDIIKTFKNPEAAFSYERTLVAMLRANPNTLNIAEGGLGGSGMTGKRHSEETKKLMSASAKVASEALPLRELRKQLNAEAWNDPDRRAKRISAMNTPEAKERRRLAALSRIGWKFNPNSALKQQKPCTIDGVTIYPSRKALVQALGNGKNGSGHPNFKYVIKT